MALVYFIYNRNGDILKGRLLNRTDTQGESMDTSTRLRNDGIDIIERTGPVDRIKCYRIDPLDFAVMFAGRSFEIQGIRRSKSGAGFQGFRKICVFNSLGPAVGLGF